MLLSHPIRTAILLLPVLMCAHTSAAADELQNSDIEFITHLDSGADDVAVTSDGRVFISFSSPTARIGEVVGSKFVRMPALEAFLGSDRINALSVDRQGHLWILAGENPVTSITGWDINTQKKIFSTTIASTGESELVDLAVDDTNKVIYLLDESQDGVFIHTIGITSHMSKLTKIKGRTARSKTVRNFLALERTGSWLYYTLKNSPQLNRLRTSDLRLGTPIHKELVAEIPSARALAVDAAGRIYVAEANEDALGVRRPREAYTRLLNHEGLEGRPQGISLAKDGTLYMTVRRKSKDALLRLKPSCGCEADPAKAGPALPAGF